MSTKWERQAAREAVAAHHEDRSTELLGHVGEVVDRFRAGELEAFETDQIMFQCSGAAKELWKFCHLNEVVFTAESDRRACTGRLVGTRRTEAAMKSAAGISSGQMRTTRGHATDR